MNLELSDDEKAAMTRELDRIIQDDRCEAPCGAFAERSASYPLSSRIQMLKAILNKIRPEPIREPLPHQNNTPRREQNDTADGELRPKRFIGWAR